MKQEKGNFKGLRTMVPGKSLLDSKIIDKATFDAVQQGKKTAAEVSKDKSVNKYLQGSDSIAGIYNDQT